MCHTGDIEFGYYVVSMSSSVGNPSNRVFFKGPPSGPFLVASVVFRFSAVSFRLISHVP